MEEKNWQVAAAPARDVLGPRVFRHYEDGFVYQEWPEGYVVSLFSDYGNLYHHPHRFLTVKEADDFVIRVQAFINQGGTPDLTVWQFVRVIYGSPAYQEQEPEMAWRERQDDIMGLNDIAIPVGGWS